MRISISSFYKNGFGQLLSIRQLDLGQSTSSRTTEAILRLTGCKITGVVFTAPVTPENLDAIADAFSPHEVHVGASAEVYFGKETK